MDALREAVFEAGLSDAAPIVLRDGLLNSLYGKTHKEILEGLKKAGVAKMGHRQKLASIVQSWLSSQPSPSSPSTKMQAAAEIRAAAAAKQESDRKKAAAERAAAERALAAEKAAAAKAEAEAAAAKAAAAAQAAAAQAAAAKAATLAAQLAATQKLSVLGPFGRCCCCRP